MLALVIGGSGSGKSEYAEEMICSRGGRRVYLATLFASDEESRDRILRHRRLRKNRGFTTIEKPVEISDISLLPDSNVLLEDMGNLLANTMYGNFKMRVEGNAVDHIVRDVMSLARKCSNLVIVTNDVFSEGMRYDMETERYRKNLAAINRKIAATADFAAEIICGQPNILKGQL